MTPDPHAGGRDTGPGRDGLVRDERVVPVFAVTRGRTRSRGRELPLEAVVTTVGPATEPRRVLPLQGESLTIVRLCERPMSLAEIGASLRVPVGVARVLVGDLVAAGYLNIHLLRPAEHATGPSQAILGRLLDGLRAR
jgi:hypothetical protein